MRLGSVHEFENIQRERNETAQKLEEHEQRERPTVVVSEQSRNVYELLAL